MERKNAKMVWNEYSETEKQIIEETWSKYEVAVKYLSATDEYVFRVDRRIKVKRDDLDSLISILSGTDFGSGGFCFESFCGSDADFVDLCGILYLYYVSERVLKSARKEAHRRRLGRSSTSWVKLVKRDYTNRGRTKWIGTGEFGTFDLKMLNKDDFLYCESEEEFKRQCIYSFEKFAHDDDLDYFIEAAKIYCKVCHLGFKRNEAVSFFKWLKYKWRVERGNVCVNEEYEKKLKSKINKFSIIYV